MSAFTHYTPICSGRSAQIKSSFFGTYAENVTDTLNFRIGIVVTVVISLVSVSTL